MFQLNLPAFGTKFHDGNTRRIINYKLGASDRTDSFHDSVPVRIRQRTGTELLGIHVGLHRQHTVYQLLLRHLQTEDQAGLLSPDRDIVRNIQYERRLTHRRAGSDQDQIRRLEAGHPVIEIDKSGRKTRYRGF